MCGAAATTRGRCSAGRRRPYPQTETDVGVGAGVAAEAGGSQGPCPQGADGRWWVCKGAEDGGGRRGRGNWPAIRHGLADTFLDASARPRPSTLTRLRLLTRKGGNIFRVGIFLGFARLTTRTEGPHGACVRRARRNRIGRHWGVELNGPRRVLGFEGGQFGVRALALLLEVFGLAGVRWCVRGGRVDGGVCREGQGRAGQSTLRQWVRRPGA